MTNSPKSQSWRDVLPTHPAAELFPLMSEPELRELGEDIRANKLQFPIATWFDPEAKIELLVDGRNRLDAMELVGLRMDEVISSRSRLTCIDPWAVVVAVNIKRRHLTSEQKRDLIAALLKAKSEQSDRQIAKLTKTSPTTVGKIRKKSEATGDVSKVDTRTDTRGRKQPSTKTKKSVKKAKAGEVLDDVFDDLVDSVLGEVPATSVPRLSATPDDIVDRIVGEAIRLVEKMTVSQRRDFFARLQKERLVVACAAEHEAATNPIPDDLSIPAFMQRRPTS
jgi:hypothetical protein